MGKRKKKMQKEEEGRRNKIGVLLLTLFVTVTTL